MKSILVALALLCLLFDKAAGAELLLTDPVWKSAPSAADAQRAFARIDPGKRGVASRLRCHIAPNGALLDCQNMNPWFPEAMVRAAFGLIPKFVVELPAGLAARHDTLVVDVAFRLDPPEDSDLSVYLESPQIVGDAPGLTSGAPAQFGVAGRRNWFALIKASVDGTGTVSRCTAIKEVPPSEDLGARACALAQTWRLNLWQEGYAVVGGAVRIPIYVNSAGADDDPHFTRQAIFHFPAYPDGAGPFYPAAAASLHVTGRAIIECVVAASGVLSDCIPVSETPHEYDFMTAALVMVRRGAVTAQPTLVNGQALPSEVAKVVVPFNNPP